jgi:hypothetical protein
VSSPRFIVLLGSEEPIPAGEGRGWHAVEGEPAYRRVLLADETPERLDFGPGVSVWVGRQIDSLDGLTQKDPRPLFFRLNGPWCVPTAIDLRLPHGQQTVSTACRFV